MKYFCLFVCIFFVPIVLTAQNQDLKTIEHLIDNGRSEVVYQDLNLFLKNHPSNSEAFFLRAKYYYNFQSFKAALQDVDMALKFEKNNAKYYHLKGDILFGLKKYFSAAENFEKTFSLDSTFQNCRYKAAQSYLKAQKFQQAEKVLKNHAFTDSTKLLLSEIYLEGGDGISALKTINTIEKKDAEFYRQRGIVLCNAQWYKESIADFFMALDLNPNLTDVYLFRGLSYYFLGQKQNAKDDWNTALKNRHFKAKEYLDKYR